MPPFSGDVLDFFRDRSNIQVAVGKQGDPRTVPDDLFFLNRTPVVPVTDHELRARWRGTAVIADMIAVDARSSVYKMLEIKAAETEIFKVKFGTYLSESDMQQVLELGQAQLAATGQIPDFVARLFNVIAKQLTVGRRWRLESMLIGSHLDTFSFDRVNFRVKGSWGKSASQIVTLAVPVTVTATSKPITAIRNQIDYMQATGRGAVNRVLLSRAMFDAICQTDEFKSEAQSAFFSLFTLTTVPVSVTRDERITAFKRILPTIAEVVFYDAHHRYEVVSGTPPNEVRQRFLQRRWPIDAVLLDNSANDNNQAVRFLGNGFVTESALIGRVGAQSYAEGGGPADVAGEQRGPFAYTSVDPHLDPPTIHARVVQRCWPIVPEPDSSAVIYMGAITDPIPVEDSW